MATQTTGANAGAAPGNAPLITRTRLRYIPGQDRILLDGANVKDKEISIWLTRSLTLKLFQQLRANLEKGSATAGKMVLGWQQEALAIEHAAILKTDAGKGPGRPWRGEGQPRLATKVGVKQVNAGQLQLGFFAQTEPIAAIQLQNAPLHRFAAMLALRIQQAGWDQGLDLSWLGKAPAKQLPPPGKAN